MYYTYILQSDRTGKLYIGHTNNLEDRIRRHNSGENMYGLLLTTINFMFAFFYFFRRFTQMFSKVKYNNLESFINAFRATGRYSFSREEAKANLKLSEKALNQALFRYSRKGKITKVRSGFYAILPPEYSQRGMLPVSLFIDDLMKSLDRDYYIALFSAAAYHGAAHQQPMTFYVITKRPALRNLKSDKLSLNFYVKKEWSPDDIVQKKSDAGYIKVSGPELTALDLLTYDFSLGRVFTVLEELVEEMRPDKLLVAAERFPTTTVQRLGYLLDKELDQQHLAKPLKELTNKKSLSKILLMKGEVKSGEVDEDWKVIVNIDLESDL